MVRYFFGLGNFICIREKSVNFGNNVSCWTYMIYMYCTVLVLLWAVRTANKQTLQMSLICSLKLRRLRRWHLPRTRPPNQYQRRSSTLSLRKDQGILALVRTRAIFFICYLARCIAGSQSCWKEYTHWARGNTEIISVYWWKCWLFIVTLAKENRVWNCD